MRYRKRFAGARVLALAGLFSLVVGCSESPVSVEKSQDEIFVQLTETPHRFACDRWSPAAPSLSRTLFDLRLNQIDTATSPSTELVAKVQAAGGRVVYRYSGPMIRAELDVAAVPGLHADRALNYATTVTNPDVREVTLIVLLDHDLTTADLDAAKALGGRITHEFHGIEGYVVVIDDARVPAVRALRGVKLAGFNAMGCIAGEPTTPVRRVVRSPRRLTRAL